MGNNYATIPYRGHPTYSEFMEAGAPFIRLKLDTTDPIELSEFVGAFTAIASQYDRFIRDEQPDADPSATLFVKEVRAGCIEAELIPWIVGLAGSAAVGAIAFMASANTLATFVEKYGKALGLYKKKGEKDPTASVAKLKDFTDQVAAIANAPNSSLSVAAIEIKNGKEETRAAFKFTTKEAREIRDHVQEHVRELEKRTDADHFKVLMVFKRTDVDRSKPGKRSGELVRIDSLFPKKKLGLIYASDLAEQKIKHEIGEASENVYKKGFVVDVNVEMNADGRPIAYRLTHLHQVIDLPDEEDDED